MGQMRFRDPKSDKIKFIADDNGKIFAIGKDGKVSAEIETPEAAEVEIVEVKQEDFRGSVIQQPQAKIILPNQPQ